MYTILKSEVLIQESKYGEVLEIIGEAIKISEENREYLYYSELLRLKAVAFRGQGRAGEAKVFFDQAEGFAQQRGFLSLVEEVVKSRGE